MYSYMHMCVCVCLWQDWQIIKANKIWIFIYKASRMYISCMHMWWQRDIESRCQSVSFNDETVGRSRTDKDEDEDQAESVGRSRTNWGIRRSTTWFRKGSRDRCKKDSQRENDLQFKYQNKQVAFQPRSASYL